MAKSLFRILILNRNANVTIENPLCPYILQSEYCAALLSCKHSFRRSIIASSTKQWARARIKSSIQKLELHSSSMEFYYQLESKL